MGCILPQMKPISQTYPKETVGVFDDVLKSINRKMPVLISRTHFC